MKFKVLTARQGRDGQADKAVPVADYMVEHAREALERSYGLVQELPVECHWSARVVLSDPAPDTAQEGWLGEGP